LLPLGTNTEIGFLIAACYEWHSAELKDDRVAGPFSEIIDL